MLRLLVVTFTTTYRGKYRQQVRCFALTAQTGVIDQ
jgi:hypothetical protein